MKERFKLAVCQMEVTEDKKENIKKAVCLIKEAAENKAELVVLPEMFNCPYDNKMFPIFAEELDGGETVTALKEAAAQAGVYVAAGSIPESSENKIYNTSIIFDKKGSIIAKHRKMHLFDINIPGKIVFKESDILAPGDEVTVVDTELCKLGIAICYDMRFPELFRIMALKGAELVLVPGAFNMVTGPAHWESLIRIRAVDNQVYVAAASPARNINSGYVAYGNSMIAEPWGNIISRTDERESIIYADIDSAHMEKVRNELPLLKNRRTDIYELKEK
ncbi:MAG: carbon-nitrogen hydrolase family protein [Clostridia bacterium]|nr:carbon-nitrogen hydrolase family protein [Clostridia bacterium]